jgi:hypothetical protein
LARAWHGMEAFEAGGLLFSHRRRLSLLDVAVADIPVTNHTGYRYSTGTYHNQSLDRSYDSTRIPFTLSVQ